jgi:site-specific DNA recombinase
MRVASQSMIEMPLVSPKRCAVYCRVSSDERLDQSFNSIDAQKEAGHAFIKSQTHEGWIAAADDYEDPGFSGGNMERPALKRLFADIAAGKIDIVVVYKIDRLSRSLADFARMVETFDEHRVSFSAVTQQINSATSMGRLMLNVLLSFAQFEREVTSERIRDKFAASKAKGIWMGGPVPIGYVVINRKLIIKEDQARLVRRMFEDYLTIQSTTNMVQQYAKEGLLTKAGVKFSKQAVYTILNNRMYLGQITYKGKSFAGEHEAIITQSQWDAVHQIMAKPHFERASITVARKRDPVLLRGLLYTIDGELLVPTFAKRLGKTYHYYTPFAKQKMGAWASQYGTLPAEPIDDLVTEQIIKVLSAPHLVQAVWDRVKQSHPQINEPEVVLPMRHLSVIWKQLFPLEQCRLAQLLIELVVVSDGGIEIYWCDLGWSQLLQELAPGSIGAELQECEESQC